MMHTKKISWASMFYTNHISYQDSKDQAIGVLITNLGTPDAPTKQALRPYLREFLLDTRVVEPPPKRWVWKLILNLIILNTRPKESAKAYQQVWGKYGDGSPLLDICKDQLKSIKTCITAETDQRVEFEVGMRYGNPSIASALQKLASKGCTRFIILPLYPQYASATTGSTFDAIANELKTWRWIPELKFIPKYYDNVDYINALANSIREHQQENGEPDLLIMSFHGIPQRYFDAGDPYYHECHHTATLLADALGLAKDKYKVTFQSLFGKEEWIKPYTDATLKALPSKGVKHLQVICPGFSADCLETIEEIDQENREYFEENGGENFSYIPALNTRKDHTDMLASVIKNNISCWS